MNVITNRISMDLMTASKEWPLIYAVQGECNTRSVQLSLLCGGSPWPIPEGTVLTVRYGRIGRGGGYFDTLPDGSCAYSYEGNTATIMLAPQMMMAAGTVVVQVEMEHEDQVLVTFPFKLVVEVNPAVGILEPETYINWKKWLEQELDDYIEKVNQSGQLLGGTMAGAINMNGNAITGLPEPADSDQAANMGYVNQQIKKVTPRNLLDNSDFRNPVNQRGIVVSTNGFIVDRWYAFEGEVMITPNGIVTSGNGYLQQRLPAGTIRAEKAYTLVVYYSDGTADVNTNGEYIRSDVFDLVNNIKSNEKTIEAVALYEGEYTVETVPAYQAKGYGVELTECLRYQKSFNKEIARMMTVASNSIYFHIPFDIPFARDSIPTIVGAFQIKNLTGAIQTGFAFSVHCIEPNGITIRAEKTSHGITDGVLKTEGLVIIDSNL